MTPDPDTSRPITFSVALLALLCCLIWSANSLAIKFTTDHIPPIGAAGIRFGIGMVPVVLWAMLARIPLRLSRLDCPIVIFHGLLLFVQISLLNWGTSRTEAARSSVLLAANVVFVALLAPLVVGGGERLTTRRIVGFAVGSVGLLVVFGDQIGGWRPDILAGDCAVLASSFLLGFKITHMKRSIVALHPCHILFWQGVISVPLFMAYSVVVEGVHAYDWRLPAVIALGYQGLGVTGFCFICWTMLLRRHDAASLAIFGFASPLFGAALSIMMRADEQATMPLLAGAVLVTIGIMLATTRIRKKRLPDGG